MQKPNSCILCDGVEFRKIHQKNQWQYLCCMNCGLIFLHPRPTSQALLEKYRNYLPDQPDEISQWKEMMQPIVIKSADLIEAQVITNRGKLLDIGCGYGFFLQEMMFRGWQVKGIEIAQTGRQFMRNSLDIHVYSEPLEHIDFPENIFDVVTLFYVLEHVLDPLALLSAIKRILKPEGLVLIRWPHSTPIVKILGPLARKFDLFHTPYHLYDFSPKTIENLLVQSGFTSIKTWIGGHTSPSKRMSRWTTMLFGCLAETLYFLTGGNYLLPGVSKTTLAFKPNW